MSEKTEQAPDMNRNQVLLEALRNISPEQAKAALDEKGIDPKVGIAIAGFPEVEPINFEGQEYFLYAARVLPSRADGTQPYVTPHNHHKGLEPYVFYGEGEMNFGHVAEDGSEVLWSKPVKVSRESYIIIQEGEVHSFRNTGQGEVDFLFACPKAHLVDNSPEHLEGDRYIVKNLKNGIPPHYLK